MAVVYPCVGILTVDVIFFRSPGVFHSQDSFPSMFRPRLWETSSGVVAVGVFAAEVRRELWTCPSRLRLIYVVHAYCCYVIGQHSDNWNLIGRFLITKCSDIETDQSPSPMSQLILQPFHHFTYITAHFPTLLLLHLHHSSFSNPSFASTSQALHLIHLASHPW